MKGGCGGCLARLVLDPQRPLWYVGQWERVVVDEVWGSWLTNNAWGDDNMGWVVGRCPGCVPTVLRGLEPIRGVLSARVPEP